MTQIDKHADKREREKEPENVTYVEKKNKEDDEREMKRDNSCSIARP